MICISLRSARTSRCSPRLFNQIVRILQGLPPLPLPLPLPLPVTTEDEANDDKLLDSSAFDPEAAIPLALLANSLDGRDLVWLLRAAFDPSSRQLLIDSPALQTLINQIVTVTVRCLSQFLDHPFNIAGSYNRARALSICTVLKQRDYVTTGVSAAVLTHQIDQSLLLASPDAHATYKDQPPACTLLDDAMLLITGQGWIEQGVGTLVEQVITVIGRMGRGLSAIGSGSGSRSTKGDRDKGESGSGPGSHVNKARLSLCTSIRRIFTEELADQPTRPSFLVGHVRISNGYAAPNETCINCSGHDLPDGLYRLYARPILTTHTVSMRDSKD